MPLTVVPLREHREDVPDLIAYYTRQITDSEHLAFRRFSTSSVNYLRNRPWPGNVRELENLVQRLAALYSEETISQAIVARELAEREEAAASGTAGGQDQGLSGTVECQLASYFAAHQNDLPASGLYDRVLREVEKPLITLTLQATRGNQVRAAQVLGLNRNTLRKKIRELDIPVIRGGR